MKTTGRTDPKDHTTTVQDVMNSAVHVNTATGKTTTTILTKADDATKAKTNHQTPPPGNGDSTRTENPSNATTNNLIVNTMYGRKCHTYCIL